MISSNDFQKAVELIDKSKNVLLVTHTRPDGDACGCVAAMSDTLAALGKDVKSLLPSPVPEWYEFLFIEPPKILDSDITVKQLKEWAGAEPEDDWGTVGRKMESKIKTALRGWLSDEEPAEQE